MGPEFHGQFTRERVGRGEHDQVPVVKGALVTIQKSSKMGFFTLIKPLARPLASGYEQRPRNVHGALAADA